jgi:hypothetical protein
MNSLPFLQSLEAISNGVGANNLPTTDVPMDSNHQPRGGAALLPPVTPTPTPRLSSNSTIISTSASAFGGRVGGGLFFARTGLFAGAEKIAQINLEVGHPFDDPVGC